MAIIDYLKRKSKDGGVELSKEKAGNVPGDMVFTGEKKVSEVMVHYLEYNSESMIHSSSTGSVFNMVKVPADGILQWYDVRGLHDINIISKISKAFKIHPLVQEDIVDVSQRPKFEEYENGIFIAINPLFYHEDIDEVETETISIYFGKEFLLSFQEKIDDNFLEVRERIMNQKGRIRSKGVDYLAYAMIDRVVDSYIVMMEQVEDDIEDLEIAILNDPNESCKERIHHYKFELIKVRKAVSPLREAIDKFRKSEHPLIHDDTKIFIRDVHDHLAQVHESIELFKDRLNGIQDLYNSEVSFRMNKAMQFLTIVTAIFVPLSFLVGLYGMNFEYIPELKFKYGYFTLLGFMVVVVIGMIIFFKRKKWL